MEAERNCCRAGAVKTPLFRPVLLSVVLSFACGLTGRAQYTEVPATVAPGSFLLETDALSLVVDRDGPDKYQALGVGSLLLTTGLTSTWDVQLGAQLYLRQRFDSRGFTDRQSGVGDVYVRTKWRFFSNEYVSMAILPYVKIPTNSGGVGNDHVEGGIALPWETYVLGGFLTINSMIDVARLRNAANDAHGTYTSFSTAATKSLTKFLSFYAEANAAKSPGVDWIATLGGGVYLSFSDRLGIDVAVYRGLNREAPDWNPVVRVNYGF